MGAKNLIVKENIKEFGYKGEVKGSAYRPPEILDKYPEHAKELGIESPESNASDSATTSEAANNKTGGDAVTKNQTN